MNFDRQDGLLVVGVVALLGGIASWSVPAAAVVLGMMCFVSVWLIERTKRLDGSKKETT